MPAIQRRDRQDEWWVDFRWRGKRIRKRSPLQTKRGAETFERTLLNEFNADEEVGRDPFAGPPPKFQAFAERWMNEYVIPRNRPSTVRTKGNCLRNHIVPMFGRMALDQISTATIDTLVAQMKRGGLGPKTINNTLSVLHTCLTSARRWRIIRMVPEFQWLRVPEPPLRWLTEDEEQALVDACDLGFWQALVVLFLHTGLRFTEAAVLTWEDIDLEREPPVVHICKGGAEGKPGPTKTGSHRDVPLDRVVLDMLAGLPRHSDFIFPSPTGKQMNPASKIKYLHKFCKRAGIEPCSWHQLRHTFASRLAAQGVPLPVIQKLLGHTTLKMTMRYVHIDQRTMNATAEIVQRAMAAPRRFGHPMVTTPIALDRIRLPAAALAA
jgi:integrase